jgi:hypothetical protein
MNKLILGIDLDGTVWEPHWPSIGPMKPNAAKVLRRLHKAGHILIIWTARGYPEHIAEAKNCLERHGICYHAFNEPSEEMKALYPTEARKLHFDVLIDDISLGGIPDDWEEIYDLLVKVHGIERTGDDE